MLIPNDKRHYVDKSAMAELRKAARARTEDVRWDWALNTICLQNEILRMIVTSPMNDLHAVEQGIQSARQFFAMYDEQPPTPRERG